MKMDRDDLDDLRGAAAVTDVFINFAIGESGVEG